MCALVLALRKVPIFAPGGGGAALGSADQPSYSVAISDEAAAAAREKFAKAKSEQRMKTTKASSKSWNDLGASTGAQTGSNPDAALRSRSYQIGPVSETNALNELNSRSPAADLAQDWQSDNSSPINRTPSSKLNSPHLAAPSDLQRNQDIDEVYGLLRRASTRGKRRESYSRVHGPSERNSAAGNAIPIIEEPDMPTTSSNYQDYQVSPQLSKQYSPLRGEGGSNSRPGEGANGGFGATYNPYVTAAPKYDYPPPTSPPSRSAQLPSAPVTSSSTYPSPLRTTGTAAQQKESMSAANPPGLGSPPRRNNRGTKKAYAAELDGRGD
ncbi:MAG: hypothetical protein LQ340_008041 [Diploschistes diacapsis]|nr:MAG: hypothetical protein LQ340_008041 [Diploschistes diacapsis]